MKVEAAAGDRRDRLLVTVDEDGETRARDRFLIAGAGGRPAGAHRPARRRRG
ncbi:MAG: hypothetical protein MZW92_80195 [Comamonadaceae bacterium]|nr:hypothetical protein [Comamonadaceae bacterium]